jgi:16S rRNA processing protein RimM
LAVTAEPIAYLALGVIARPHGVRGEVRVAMYNPGSTALEDLERIYLAGPNGGAPAPYDVVSVRATNDAVLLTLENVTDRDAALALRGREVLVDRRDLAPLAEDELYVGDLVGCEVVTSAGSPLGRIAEVLDVGPHPLLVIHDGDLERLLPYVPVFVAQVDLAARRVVVDPPEGLPQERRTRR